MSELLQKPRTAWERDIQEIRDEAGFQWEHAKFTEVSFIHLARWHELVLRGEGPFFKAWGKLEGEGFDVNSVLGIFEEWMDGKHDALFKEYADELAARLCDLCGAEPKAFGPLCGTCAKNVEAA